MLVLSPDCPSLRISPSRTGSQFHPCLSSLWDGAAWFSTDKDVSGRTARDHASLSVPTIRDLLSAPPLPGSRHRMALSTGHLDVSGTPARLAVKCSALPGGCRIEDGVCDHNLLVLIDCDSHSPGAVSLDRDSSPSPHLSTPLSPYGPVSLRAALAASSDLRFERFAWLLRAACRPRRQSSVRSRRPRRRARRLDCGVLPPWC